MSGRYPIPVGRNTIGWKGLVGPLDSISVMKQTVSEGGVNERARQTVKRLGVSGTAMQ